MKEKRITFKSGKVTIEGLVYEGPSSNGVVVTHPHPLYGGSMSNNVVDAMVQAYGDSGYSTLRFNFRGVGRSEGSYGDGVGEQEDMIAAVAYLTRLGKTSGDLAGYSFGAWVNAQCMNRLSGIHRMIMVSPPVNFMDFSFFQGCPELRLVMAGSEDDIAPPAMIQEMLPVWNPHAELRVIQGADHFYWGRTDEIRAAIQGLIKTEVGRLNE